MDKFIDFVITALSGLALLLPIIYFVGSFVELAYLIFWAESTTWTQWIVVIATIIVSFIVSKKVYYDN